MQVDWLASWSELQRQLEAVKDDAEARFSFIDGVGAALDRAPYLTTSLRPGLPKVTPMALGVFNLLAPGSARRGVPRADSGSLARPAVSRPGAGLAAGQNLRTN